MPLAINISAALEAAVRAGSGAKNTIKYTAKGQASHMVVIPAFDRSATPGDVGSGIHPAFVINGVEQSERYISQFVGHRRDDELVSAYGVEPVYDINHDEVVALGRATGAGWHCMTNADYGMMICLMHMLGYTPGGPNDYGRDYATGTAGVRADGLAPGVSSGSARTLSGSGPASWRHDGTAFGAEGFSGPVWQWSPGMRVVDYELQIIPDNDAALPTTDLSASSGAWRAISGADGSLIAPGSAGAIMYGTSTGDYALNGGNFESIASVGSQPIAAAAMQLLRALGLAPIVAAGDGDYFSVNSGERVPFRCGDWSRRSDAGPRALNVSGARGNRYGNVGCRAAFYDPSNL